MNEKILIVADEAEGENSLAKLLEQDEFVCAVTGITDPVFTFPDETVPDLVIFDITVMNIGGDMVANLRDDENKELKKVPVIYIIDYDDPNKSDFNKFQSDKDKFEFALRSEDYSEVLELVRNRFRPKEASTFAGFSSLLETENEEPGIPEGSPIDSLSYQLIKALSNASECRDAWFKGHAKRTAIYARELMRRLGGSEEEQFEIYCAALVHDIGMVSVPRDILNKKGELTPDDYERVKEHIPAGMKIVDDIEDMDMIKQAVRAHHERFDGNGYPDGLKGSDIPRCARIIAVASDYDAMTSARPHRKALSHMKVREAFMKGNGTKYDPDVVRIALQLINEDKDYDDHPAPRNEWKILIVDDDPMILKMAEYILGRHKQYNLCKANSGKLALKKLKDDPDIDLILLDVEMPLMDGVETLIKIRSDKETKDIPVIFVTADSSRKTLEKAMKYKVNGYITKPFAPHFFVKRINEILNHLDTE